MLTGSMTVNGWLDHLLTQLSIEWRLWLLLLSEDLPEVMSYIYYRPLDINVLQQLRQDELS